MDLDKGLRIADEIEQYMEREHPHLRTRAERVNVVVAPRGTKCAISVVVHDRYTDHDTDQGGPVTDCESPRLGGVTL